MITILDNVAESIAEQSTPLEVGSDLDEKSDASDIVTSNERTILVPSQSLIPRLLDSPSLDQQFHLQATNISNFYEINELFMFGPSFAQEYHAALYHLYVCSPVVVQDFNLAMFSALAWGQHRFAFWNQVDINRAAKSLQRLRTAAVLCAEDAVVIANLGAGLAVFDAFTVCTAPAMILRYSLTLLKPWYPEVSRNPCLDPITISPIFWDTIGCLVFRNVPILKFSFRVPLIIDRVAGLTTTLLPILYDLCVVSCQVKESGLETHTPTLKAIEERLSSWYPTQLEYTSSFSSEEAAAMKAHALMHQASALIIAHRIANPFGANDGVSRAYADDILLQLSKYHLRMKPGTRLKNVAFPVLLAMIEIPEMSTEKWEAMVFPNKAPLCIRRWEAFVNYARKKRLKGFMGSLFDLFDAGPDFVALP